MKEAVNIAQRIFDMPSECMAFNLHLLLPFPDSIKWGEVYRAQFLRRHDVQDVAGGFVQLAFPVHNAIVEFIDPPHCVAGHGD